MKWLVTLYDQLETGWTNHRTDQIISWLLIGGFFAGLALVTLARYTGLVFVPKDANFFFAIDVAFHILLILEILGLIFVLPRSVADAVGKQFEILSVILLRSAFKEFSNFKNPLEWTASWHDPIYHMMSDAFGALVIFLIIGVYYKIQRHEKITRSDTEQAGFIGFKKSLGVLLLVVFILLGAYDLLTLLKSGHYQASFNTFYTVLIFADILILLYSLRYSTRYYNLFRYSSFAFATVLIRLSLISPPYIKITLGITAGLFVLGLTSIYNYFLKHDSRRS